MSTPRTIPGKDGTPTSPAADSPPADGISTSPADGTPAGDPTTVDIPALREEIDRLDADILRLVNRRSEVSRRIGAARIAAGGTRIVYNREMAVLARFRELGPEGRELAMVLLRLGRGRLGSR